MNWKEIRDIVMIGLLLSIALNTIRILWMLDGLKPSP